MGYDIGSASRSALGYLQGLTDEVHLRKEEFRAVKHREKDHQCHSSLKKMKRLFKTHPEALILSTPIR